MRLDRWCLAALALATACAAGPQEAADPEPSAQSAVAVRFEGNRSFFGLTLDRVIEDSLIDFGRDPTREVAILDAAQDLQDYYVSRGYPDAVVTHRIERAPRLGAIFTIDEGVAVTVVELTLEGNRSIPSTELRELWTRTSSGLLGLGDPYFVEGDLRVLSALILARYRSQGYLDAVVSDPHIERAPGAIEARVRIDIEEGPRYRLVGIEIDDTVTAPTPLPLEAEIGQTYDVLMVSSLRGRLRRALEDAGYPDPRLSVRTEVDHERHEVRLYFSGQRGDRKRVGEIVIEGNERTADYVLTREIRFREGEWFDGGAVEATRQGLYSSGLFTKVTVEREDRDDDTVRLHVAVEEADARALSLLGGWGSYERARAGAYVEDGNLFGLGQRLRVGGRVSTRGWGADTTWTEPRILGSDTSLTVTAFVKERQEPSFTDVSRGVSTALARPLFANTQLRVGYSIADRNGSDIDATITVGTPDQFRVGQVFTELVFDNRDSAIYPEHGQRHSVRVEYAGSALGSEIDFTRLVAGSSILLPLPLGDHWTLGAAAEAGVIWPLLDGTVPIQERFFNGGYDTVRSFEQSQLGPRSTAGDALGGEFRTVLSTELRFPIFRALRGAVFADAGNVGVNVQDFGLSNLRYGIGGGLRFVLPIGPVRVDAAANPDPEPGERDYALHVSVGLPF